MADGAEEAWPEFSEPQEDEEEWPEFSEPQEEPQFATIPEDVAAAEALLAGGPLPEASGETWPSFDEEGSAPPTETWPSIDEEEKEEVNYEEAKPAVKSFLPNLKSEPTAEDSKAGAFAVPDESYYNWKDEGRGYYNWKDEGEQGEPYDGVVKKDENDWPDEEEADAVPGRSGATAAAEYEPTSPAEEPAVEPVPGVGVSPARLKEKKEKKVIICPKLLVGSQLSKECPLKPNRWIQVGRHSEATILMPNPAVSKHHCKLQWKKGSRVVQLRALDGVTYVNDTRLEYGGATNMKHGDLIKINGKGASFRLLLNMKPINDMLPSVESLANYTAACKDEPPSRSPEEEARRRIRKLREATAAARKKAIEHEERLITIQSSRAQCFKRSQEDQEKAKWFEKDQERLYNLLHKSRDEWLDRLQQQSEAHHKAVQPLQEGTGTTQTQRDSLKKMRDQREREMHPEIYDKLPTPTPTPTPSNAPTPVKRDGQTTPMPVIKSIKYDAKPDEADGEEQAFADAPARGLSLENVKEDKPPAPKPTIEVLAGAEDDIADLFGDFDSEEEGQGKQEPDSKKQRLA